MKNIQVYSHVMKRMFPEDTLIKTSPEVRKMAKAGRKSSPSLMSSVLFRKPTWWKGTTGSDKLSPAFQTQILEHTHLPPSPHLPHMRQHTEKINLEIKYNKKL